ncbi:MAG TPA: ABC transporter permease [Pyrinomonadaceae bacterium]|jgi:lipopolysaccharide transport system permease protein|nr:ABC transporter permease [Pyrinomonadaceae bacterium]
METTNRNKAGALGATPAARTPALASTPHPAGTHRLPDEPLVVIQPAGSAGALNLRELWDYRGLLYYLIWRDVKVRYKQTVLGVAWVVLQPLMMTLIFTVVLGMLVRIPSGRVPYPILVYVGLLPWTFFSSAVSSAGSSLISNSHLITKVYFPRLLVPMSAIGSRLIDLFIAFVILAGMMFYYRVGIGWTTLLLPALILLTTLLSLGVGTLLAALNVKYRDVGILLPVVIQLWMYVSPVLYPASLVPERWRRLYDLNPIVGIVQGFRGALFHEGFDGFALGVTAAVTLVVLVYAAYLFRRVESGFADVI